MRGMELSLHTPQNNFLLVNVMLKLEHLFGTYQKTGTRIFKQGRPDYLLIATRKAVTAMKPPLFLILKGTGKDRYISSMYPVKGYPDAYKIEFNGQIGFVTLSEESCIIAPMVFETAKYINSSLVTESVTPPESLS